MILFYAPGANNGFTLLFGPQDPNIDNKILSDLRKTLLNSHRLQWILETLKELPLEWEKLSGIAELTERHGISSIQQLLNWVRTGTPAHAFPLPNILVTPLVVAIQLAPYTQLLTLLNPEIELNDKLEQTLKHGTETIGLCTGLLSAAAVASSATLSELEKHGAPAIRMAMAIGSLVDAEDAIDNGGLKRQSLAVGWASPAAEAELGTILEQFLEAYMSVISEARLTNITVLKTDAADITNKLKNAGFIYTETALRGPFHCGGRTEQAKSLLQFFDTESSYQFADASQLAFSTRSADGTAFGVEGKLHHAASRAMLTDQADWHKLFTALHESTTKQKALIAFGSQRFLPQWFLGKLGPLLAHAADVDFESGTYPTSLNALLSPVQEDAIAVVGMACHFPGGNDLHEFWDTLCAGQSQHTEVPSDRVDFETSVWRENDGGKKWFGNFVRDHDAFDHKFFKKSPREMVSTDLQHRLVLQAAYQAVEQSGYLNVPGVSKNVGCFVGIGVADHENNVASYSATAYTATGNLKAFAAGKISHFFGWSGPSVTIDTACSSSALAVHYATKAILSGECEAAIAGGTSIMTSPEWYQNLDGASFLSPTGQRKPFDEAADGYCRGEGAGAVFLKKLSAAIEDGDQILGVINASCVNQNENCSAITAPSVVSLSNVFDSVIRKAGLSPEQISVVEAHGTGTAVGDLAEYDSVRKVLGGPGRAEPVSLGSVKGLIGHLECASGIAALIKLMLMLYHGAIPPQPSFRMISARLKASPSDNIEIQTRLKPWDSDFRAALLNNYGASGSNASIVVTGVKVGETRTTTPTSQHRHPFWFSGIDARSLQAYATKFLRFLRSRPANDSRFIVANLSFYLSRQSNRSLGSALIFGYTTVDELEAKLSTFAEGRGGELTSIIRSPHVP
ncbi:thiolase-like protein [Phaeosphaeriaceae sp. PMI808]|nr:thiolase-like protein [Phaeosphaeriaceae sp. PMI808]